MRGTVVILTVFAFSCAVMTAQDKTVVKGELGPEGAPKEVDFFYRSGESVSVPVENGRFRVELPTDVTKSYDVGMGRHVKVTIVPEGGTLTISRLPDGRCTVSSDKVNSLTVALDSLMSFRRRNYKDSTLMINEYKRVIHSNRDNAVGYMALFFLTNFGNTDPKTRFELAGTLAPNMLAEPRTAKLKRNIEAVYNTSVGMRFQDFEGIDMAGNTVRLSDYAGRGNIFCWISGRPVAVLAAVRSRISWNCTRSLEEIGLMSLVSPSGRRQVSRRRRSGKKA